MENKLYQQFFESSPFAIVLLDINSGNCIKMNQSFKNLCSYTPEELSHLNFWNLFLDKNKKQFIKKLKSQKKISKIHTKLINKNLHKISITLSCFLLEEQENLVWMQLEENKEQQEHEIIYEDNKTLLEYIAIENSLKKTLNKIVNFAEKRNRNSICSILLLDKEKKHLFTASAPRLPEFYSSAINGIEIGDKIGSCGSAAFNKKRIIVDDIDSHENWQNFLELTNEANLHSCWSEPIFSSKNEILGTFAIYTNTKKEPSDFEIKLIETYSNLASKAIEKDTNTKNLIERERELEQLFDNTQIGLMYISSKRVIIKANKKLADIFDYNEAEEMEGLKLINFYLSKESFKDFERKYFNTLKNTNKLDVEYRLRKKDGSIIYCEISGRSITSGDFSKGMLWMIKDISLRKEYETKLKNSELLNLNILSTIPDLVWVKDKNGSYISCNQEFEKCLGKDKELIIGKTDYELTNKKLADIFREKDKLVMKSNEILINEEWVTYASNNRKVLFEISKKALKDQKGNTLGILGIGHDITIRKQKEDEVNKLHKKTAELVKSQQILLSLFDKGDTVLFMWENDKKWSIEYVSLSVSKLLGYSKEDFLERKIDYSDYIHKDDLEKVVEETKTAFTKKLDYFKQTPYRIITKENEEKWVLDNTITLKNESGQITSFISYIIDISEQVKNQELVYHQSKIASMGEMLSNISHQWRQPLSSISSLATGSKLKKEVDILSDDEFYENMDLINENAQYLSKTIDDFRSFFTLDSNIKIKHNLKNTFNKIHSLIKDSFKSSHIEIIFNIADANIVINENIFIQAILNILNNARDVLSKAELADKYVFVNLIKDKKEYLLTINDTGKGIPLNIKDKIFEPYFTTKHKAQGTGIGLYMTSQIITKHLQGSILVENINFTYQNKEFQGASFEIRIPEH